jgi:two-component system response regulator FlrC
MGRGPVSFAVEAEQCLLAYAWPGNVRELDNIVQRALILQPGDMIYANDLLFDQSAQLSVSSPKLSVNSDKSSINSLKPFSDNVSNTNSSQAEESVVNYSADLKQREYEIIIDALNEAGGSKKQAAEKLGISPRTLRYKMAKMREDGLVVD